MTLLLNAPLWLMVMLGLLGLGMIWTGIQRDQKSLRTGGFAAIALALLLLVLRSAVPTDEKTVDRQTRQLVTAVSSGNWPTVDQLLKHASMMGWQGQKLAARTHELADQYQLQSVNIYGLDVHREPLMMVATLQVVSHHREQMVDTVTSTWHLEYQKSPDGWVLTNVVPVRIGNSDTSEAQQIVGGAR